MECAEELRIDVRFSERLSNWERLRKLTILTSELQYGPAGKNEALFTLSVAFPACHCKR